MTKIIEKQGSVRVDLLGGTLDLEPINLILPNVYTLNLATSLKAEVRLTESEREGIEFISHDYNDQKFFSSQELQENDLSFFGPLSFVVEVFRYFKISSNMICELKSGSPAGAGLGGSSAMGVTIFKALMDWTKNEDLDVIKIVKGIEAKILNSGPTGYQDYYPALYGGVLGLEASYEGVKVHQYFRDDLAAFLSENLILVFSNESRNSGINNWEVYKNFFDRGPEQLSQIAKLTKSAHEAILKKDYSELLELISKEGQVRRELFHNIYTKKMAALVDNLKNNKLINGAKVCGAGGGGCFILVCEAHLHAKVKKEIENQDMQVLPFSIEPPQPMESHGG